jgi:hypothetical protein
MVKGQSPTILAEVSMLNQTEIDMRQRSIHLRGLADRAERWPVGVL